MPEQVAPLWALAALPLLGGFAFAAAAHDGILNSGGVGKHGVMRPAGEAARLLRQRRHTLLKADRLLWRIGVSGLVLAAVLMVAVVPLGTSVLLDLDVGVVWFNAMDVAVWAFVWLAGWGANSALSLVGGYRFLALALAYELPLMFAIATPAVAASSLNVSVIGSQGGLWYGVWMPVAFVIYLAAVVAFSVSGPFSAPLGTDIAGGVRAELSGVDRLMFQGGQYALLAAGAAFAVPMFLGGGAGPLLPGWAWTLVKTAIVLAALVWARRRIPVLRPDEFMEVGWLVLLPAALVQLFIVAAIGVGRG
ncbi:complex I subunit 1 family protein [Flaviflexus huanghaiensis]|uniref:complex I subunit 1 family protein n=1 Tax=Flaviflexus huanghaiensis TaxID=1111473 RepID=UPI0015FD1D4D|nr:complex I subunit 1 family protein [Flaviflexus huanghaiensis]